MQQRDVASHDCIFGGSFSKASEETMRKGDRVRLTKEAVRWGAAEKRFYGTVQATPLKETVLIRLDDQKTSTRFHRSFVEVRKRCSK